MARASSQKVFSLTDPVFLAGKAGAASALALLMAASLGVPDKVTASFVAVLCCAPAALMGLRTSAGQLVGSVIGGLSGTLAAFALPEIVGVPLALTVAILCTHAIGFHQGTVVAAFTALFVQLVSFGGPLATFTYRIEAVAIAALSAFVVNVLVSAFFYKSLFRKRLRRAQKRLKVLIEDATEQGPAALHSFFSVTTQLNAELAQAVRELAWRGDDQTAIRLRQLQAEAIWLRDYAHLLVDLEFSFAGQGAAIRDFFSWLSRQDGPAPALSGPAALTRIRILEHLATRPATGRAALTQTA